MITSTFLFLILPFTFFLIEADGFSFGPRSGIKARFYETSIICLLLFSLVVPFFFVLARFLGAYDTPSWTLLFPQLLTEVTPMLRTFVSFCAIFILLIAVPIGQQGLLEKATEAIIVVKPKSGINAELRRNAIEREYIKRRVRTSPRP